MPPSDLELGPLPSRSPLSSSSNLQHVRESKGFIALTSKINSDPDKSTTIYRRFDALSARNLIFYQAELAELEELQQKYDKEDRKARDEASIVCQRDWASFAQAALEDGRERKKMDLAMKIRTVLEKYHEALAKHQALLNAPPPAETTVRAMQNWFHPTGSKPQLWGGSERTYSDHTDLVALRVPANHDRLSQFIQNNLGLFFSSHSSRTETDRDDVNELLISHAAVSTFTGVLSTILAFILMFGAVTSLYFIKSPAWSLAMVGGWTVLFAVCVSMLTNAKLDQVFAAMAAYAAVLVVFVSGNLGGGGGGCVCTPAPTPG